MDIGSTLFRVRVSLTNMVSSHLPSPSSVPSRQRDSAPAVTPLTFGEPLPTAPPTSSVFPARAFTVSPLLLLALPVGTTQLLGAPPLHTTASPLLAGPRALPAGPSSSMSLVGALSTEAGAFVNSCCCCCHGQHNLLISNNR